MKVVVIGLGSMGKRRIRLLKKQDSSIEILGMDASDERKNEAEKLYGIRPVGSIEEAVSLGAECAFVAASPLAHHGLIVECLQNNLNVFTELNVVSDGYEEMQELAKEKNRVLFLSSTFLYRSEIRYIKSRVEETEGIFSYFYHAGQYLPDWHPWEKIEDFFVFDRRTNGVREILVRELPWLTETFGDIEGWHVETSSVSKLGLSYPDTYLLLFNHAGGTKGCVLMDVVARKSTINLEVMNDRLYIAWDGTPTGVMDYDIENKRERNVSLYESFEQDKNYSKNIVEDAYQNEIAAFFQEVNDGTRPVYGFEKDKRVLDIMDGIEKGIING